MADIPVFWAAGLAGKPGPAHAFFDGALITQPSLSPADALAVSITQTWRDPRPTSEVAREYYAFHLLDPQGTQSCLPSGGPLHHHWIDSLIRTPSLAHAIQTSARTLRHLPGQDTPYTTTALVSRTGIAVIGDGCGALLLAPFLTHSAHEHLAQAPLMQALGDHLRALPRTKPACPYPVFPLGIFGQA